MSSSISGESHGLYISIIWHPPLKFSLQTRKPLGLYSSSLSLILVYLNSSVMSAPFSAFCYCFRCQGHTFIKIWEAMGECRAAKTRWYMLCCKHVFLPHRVGSFWDLRPPPVHTWSNQPRLFVIYWLRRANLQSWPESWTNGRSETSSSCLLSCCYFNKYLLVFSFAQKPWRLYLGEGNCVREICGGKSGPVSLKRFYFVSVISKFMVSKKVKEKIKRPPISKLS